MQSQQLLWTVDSGSEDFGHTYERICYMGLDVMFLFLFLFFLGFFFSMWFELFSLQVVVSDQH